MEDKIYSITLADGTVLEDLRLNGNTFISAAPINPEVFEGNCSPVVIDGPADAYGLVGEHRHMKHVETAQPVAGEFWFCLVDMSESDVKDAQIRADIDFLAAMGGVEL